MYVADWSTQVKESERELEQLIPLVYDKIRLLFFHSGFVITTIKFKSHVELTIPSIDAIYLNTCLESPIIMKTPTNAQSF